MHTSRSSCSAASHRLAAPRERRKSRPLAAAAMVSAADPRAASVPGFRSRLSMVDCRQDSHGDSAAAAAAARLRCHQSH